MRRNSLYTMFVNVADEGEKLEGNYKYVMSILQNGLMHLQRMRNVMSPATLEGSIRDEEYVDCGNHRGESEQLLHNGQHLLQMWNRDCLIPFDEVAW